MKKQEPLPQAHLQKIPKYSAGKNPNDFKKASAIKLSSNEVLWGPSPQVINALKKEALAAHFYPESQSITLKNLLSDFHGIAPENIILGNGSNEIIQFILLAYVAPTDEIIVPEITFSMYRIYSQMLNIPVKTIPMASSFKIDLPVIRKNITSRTKAIFIACPNNPTGLIPEKKELLDFIKSVPSNIVIVIDEAYADFCDPEVQINFLSLIKKQTYPNLVLLKTFSKAFGMAGLRLGYGLASGSLVSSLKTVSQPFNVNRMALAAGIASLKNLSHYRKILEKTRHGRTFLENKLDNARIPYIPSQANFVMVHVKDGESMTQNLGKKGIIVRALNSFGAPEYIRVTVSNKKHNELFIKHLLKELGK